MNTVFTAIRMNGVGGKEEYLDFFEFVGFVGVFGGEVGCVFMLLFWFLLIPLLLLREIDNLIRSV